MKKNLQDGVGTSPGATKIVVKKDFVLLCARENQKKQ